MTVVLVVILTGCPSIFGEKDEDEPNPVVGNVEGVARFANTGDHAGILISLEAIDGGQSATVSRSVAARIISTQSLVDQTTTRIDGTCQFADLDPGNYTVYASSSDSSEQAVRTSVAVVGGSTVTVDDLMLTATGSISGTVADGSTGDPEMGWIVAVAGTSFMAISDSDGSFVISGVPAGTDYPIIVLKGTQQFAGYYATVHAGRSTDAGAFNVSPSGDSMWHVDSGTPDGAVGDTGDFYLDMSNGDMYQKGTSGWVKIGNLSGPRGPAGADGADGADGTDGVSIRWQGTATSHPANPQLNWAYYNSADGASYVFDGTTWQVLARDGICTGCQSGLNLTVTSPALSGADEGTTYQFDFVVEDLPAGLGQVVFDWTFGTGATGSSGSEQVSVSNSRASHQVSQTYTADGMYGLVVVVKDTDGTTLIDENLIVTVGTQTTREYDLTVCDSWKAAGSGGQGGTIDDWDISYFPAGTDFSIKFDARNVPDKYVVFYNGAEVLNTGWRGNSRYQGDSTYPGGIAGNGSGQEERFFTKAQGVDEFIVTVFGPASGTLWDYEIRAECN
jgi:hypothetical protein